MRTLISTKSIFAIVLTFVFAAAAFPQSVAATRPSTGIFGSITKGLYSNSVFGFEIQFPRDWVVLENEEANQIIKAGKKLLEVDEKALEKNEKYRVSLLSLLKLPAGSVDNATATLSAMKQPSSSVAPLALANIVRKAMVESPAIKIDSEPRSIKIGEKQFATFDYIASAGNRSAKGKYLVTMSRDYSITLFLSYETSRDEKVITGIVNSIKFY